MKALGALIWLGAAVWVLWVWREWSRITIPEAGRTVADEAEDYLRQVTQ